MLYESDVLSGKPYCTSKRRKTNVKKLTAVLAVVAVGAIIYKRKNHDFLYYV